MTEVTGARYGPSRHIRDLAWLRARVVIDPVTGCWVWRFRRNHRGYGRYTFSTDHGVKTGSAHRLALELELGRPIGDGLSALHHCDNPPCCNGEHLFEGTMLDNTRDCLAKGRREAPRGEENGHAKLTRADIPTILAALAAGTSQNTLARRFGINQSQISRIKNGKAWL
jgi:HNH endonuclease/helix-turn-helix protein